MSAQNATPSPYEAATLAPRDELGVRVDDLGELVHEPALSHSRDGHQSDELWDPLVAGALECVSQDGELALAADELGAHVMGDVDAETRSCCERLPYRNRLGLALRVDRGRIAVLDRLARRAVGRAVHQDPVDGSRALEAR